MPYRKGAERADYGEYSDFPFPVGLGCLLYVFLDFREI